MAATLAVFIRGLLAGCDVWMHSAPLFLGTWYAPLPGMQLPMLKNFSEKFWQRPSLDYIIFINLDAMFKCTIMLGVYMPMKVDLFDIILFLCFYWL